ncbi:thiamine-phosphate kinase [Fulvivirga lutea]|uniref:Thiamine-monophosphate kinase n=1 Tax=Fulvivirga lutea TaxID=2810512 RepID=A0A975A199_9BACT|nr:thiamine-phosphate kinase [Fulvivirga lutea]QSE97302.1 thiamine-phosphate kinase [Fulvivirga lutea]
MAEKRTELSDLGEFGIIERIKNSTKNKHKSTLEGIGDDAAIIDVKDKQLLVSTDMLLEGVHFDLSYMPLAHLGYKAVAVNVSDIAAMNGVPTQITVNIGLSNRFSLEAVDTLYQGILKACEDFKVDLVGGDTSSSASGLVLSITALGQVDKKSVVKRSGAKKGDIICVTGDLGAAYLGLQVLEREKQVFLSNPEMQPQLDKYDYIVQRQLKPSARMDIIHELAELKLVPSSMIDISDGLASELMHLAKSSKIGVQIYEDKLPIDKQTYDTGYELGIDSTTAALNGGEDYELLFTINQDDYEKLKNHSDIHFIGYVKEFSEGCKMVTKQENLIDIKAQGWNHYKKD